MIRLDAWIKSSLFADVESYSNSNEKISLDILVKFNMYVNHYEQCFKYYRSYILIRESQ